MGGMGGGFLQTDGAVIAQGRQPFSGRGGGGGRAGLGQPATGGPAAGDSPAEGIWLDLGMEGPGWTGAGGLSLDVNLPQEGQKLTFSKSGGDCRLALGLRPRASLEGGFGLAWTVVWLLVALGLIAALGRADALVLILHRLPLIAVGLGLAWYFLLPGAPLGFLLFALGAIGFGWQHRRA